LREGLDSIPVLYEELVIAKWTLPWGGWSNRISRGMKVQVRYGYVSVALANRLLRTVLGTEQYFPVRRS